MSQEPAAPSRTMTLSDSRGQRLLQCLGRSLTRRCPYCGGGGVFKGWFSLKDRCPHCGVKFEPEDGYLIGSYVINIGLTAVIAIAILIALMTSTDLSVTQIQILAVVMAVGIPTFLYPFTQLLWITLDLLIHPKAYFNDRYR